MNEIEYLKSLLEKRKRFVNTEIDLEKVDVVETLLDDPALFFQIDMEYIFSVFSFLGLNDQESIDIYKKITSYENYKKYIPDVRILDESQNKH